MKYLERLFYHWEIAIQCSGKKRVTLYGKLYHTWYHHVIAPRITKRLILVNVQMAFKEPESMIFPLVSQKMLCVNVDRRWKE